MLSVAPEDTRRDHEQQLHEKLASSALQAPALRCLAALVGVAVVVHLAVILGAPIVRTSGDEASYTREAHRHIDEGVAQLLPGRMLFHHRPPFAFHFFSQFAEPELITHPEEELWIIDTPHQSWSPAMARFVRSVSLAHLLLLIGSGVCVYAICARLGAGAVGANVAAGLVLLNPRVGLYVQSLWAEILHLVLLVGGLLLIVPALERRKGFPEARKFLLLALAGVILAYASLTRGVVGGFSWIIAVMLAGEAFLDARSFGVQRAIAVGQGAACAAIFLAFFHGTLLPQRLANLEEHGTTLIAHNTWRNIEGGLFAPEDYFARYKAAAEGPEEREALSRERVFEYLWQAPKLPLLERQIDVFVKRISSSYINRGAREGRWGEVGSPVVLVALGGAGKAISWLVVTLGVAGLILRGRSSAGTRLLAVYALFYTAGLLFVIPNRRLFIQLIPPLAIFAGLAVDAAGGWLCRRVSAPPSA